MKATGIVRRTDDLGRVVIPKEIRRAFNINSGEPLEVYLEGEYICFRKCNTSVVDELTRMRDVIEEHTSNEDALHFVDLAIKILKDEG